MRPCTSCGIVVEVMPIPLPFKSMLKAGQMPVKERPVAHGARSFNAKEIALLQRFPETALEYRTCTDTLWTFDFICSKGLLMLDSAGR